MPRRPASGPSSTPRRNRLRIIGGEWRSRIIEFTDAIGLRPTADRVRETLFNWLRDEIHRARCLDLYSGSGALAFEALSRGALSALMIDNNADAVAALRDNANRLGCSDCTIVLSDALQWLHTLSSDSTEDQRFDLVFVDPPFGADLLAASIDGLARCGRLADRALVYVETAADTTSPETPPDWSLIKEKRAGQVISRLYRIVNPDSPV